MSIKHKHAKGICSACHKEADFSYEDFGIGSYEFWGSKETHHDWQWVSECCEAPVEGELDHPEPDYPDRIGEF